MPRCGQRQRQPVLLVKLRWRGREGGRPSRVTATPRDSTVRAEDEDGDGDADGDGDEDTHSDAVKVGHSQCATVGS